MLILGNPLFLYLIFPLVSLVLQVAIKYVSRNDRYKSWRREDLAVGLDLFLTALLLHISTMASNAVELGRLNESLAALLVSSPQDTALASELHEEAVVCANALSSSSLTAVLLLLALWGLSTIVRKWGWESKGRIRVWIGIALPLVLGVLVLIYVMVEAR